MTAPPDGAEEIFGRRMRRRREQLSISTRALAERMRGQGFEWHHTTVQRTESAKRPVRLNEAASIAAILSTELEKLLQPETDPAVIASLEREYDAYVTEAEDARTRLAAAEDEAEQADEHAKTAAAARDAARQQVAMLHARMATTDDRIRELRARLISARKDLDGEH